MLVLEFGLACLELSEREWLLPAQDDMMLLLLLLLRPLWRWGSADDQTSRLREGVDSAVLLAPGSMAL